jgi:hypothetical protein
MPCLSIAVTQLIGAPLYFYSKDLFYAWMAMTKQHFGIVNATMTYWWAPVKMRVSGDASVRGQLRKTEDGRLECDFPERMVQVSNHQVRPTHPERGRLCTKQEERLICIDLHRLDLPLVDRLHRPHAWPPLHHPQRIHQIHPHPRHRHDVLRLRLPITQMDHRQNPLPTPSQAALHIPQRPAFRHKRPRSHVAPHLPRRHKYQ